jgi:hypothetical protein
MHRVTALLLVCSLVTAAGLLAAPVPFPKPEDRYGPWFDGWDKPVDPARDCRFHRKRDKLTITVPGKGHGLYEHKRHVRLLRDVEGAS